MVYGEASGFPFGIGRVTTDGVFTEFGIACDARGCSLTPNGITSGPDGNLWFTEGNRNQIGKLTPLGSFTFYDFPTTLRVQPTGITVGPDGALWFAEFDGNKIGRIDTSGNITEFDSAIGPVGPDRITTGPDGNLWFTEPLSNRIGRITITPECVIARDCVITEFPLPTAAAQPRDIVAGPDGNLWFTEYNAGQLARITPAGVVIEVQKVRDGPWGIAVGAPGTNTIWITQMSGNRVARFTVGP